MYYIDQVNENYEPRKEVESKMGFISSESEMSRSESAFICGLIRKRKPKKVLELGVAAGASSSIMYQCLKDENGENFEMFSVDISERLWSDPNKKTGWVFDTAKEFLGETFHSMYLGNSIVNVIDEIGADIDFVVMDTVHSLPGEILDFIAIYPYLSKDAIVCLHDISLNQRYPTYYKSMATNVLFHSVTGDKYLNHITDSNGNRIYPNIGAFGLRKETGENIIDLFLALTLRWAYIPSRSSWLEYRSFIEKQYRKELIDILDDGVKMNCSNRFYISLDIIPIGTKCILWGGGFLGEAFYRKIHETGHCTVIAWVDRNSALQTGNVIKPEDANFQESDFVIVTTQSKESFKNISIELAHMGVDSKKIIWPNPASYIREI